MAKEDNLSSASFYRDRRFAPIESGWNAWKVAIETFGEVDQAETDGQRVRMARPLFRGRCVLELK